MFPISEAEVVGKRVLSPTVRHVALRLRKPPALPFRAGQFLQFVIDERTFRAFSIASPPAALPLVELCADVSPMGAGSRLLEETPVGDTVRFRGPFGLFTLREGETRPLEFVATGVGIAPIRSILHHLFQNGLATGRHVTLTFGNRMADDILYREEWEALATREPAFSFRPALSQPPGDWTGFRGRVTDLLGERRDLPGKIFYLCGSSEMVDDTRRVLGDRGVPESDVRFEKFI